jgi:hypothetical protein
MSRMSNGRCWGATRRIIFKIEAAGDIFAAGRGHRSIPVLAPTLSSNIVATIRGTVAVKR